MRMDITKALARRLSQGDIDLQRDERMGNYFVEYDRIEVNRIGQRMVMSLMAGKVELASVDADIESFWTHGRLHFTNLRGRIDLETADVDACRPKFYP